MKKLRWQLVILLLTALVVGVLLFTQQQPTAPVAGQGSTPAAVSGGSYTEALIGSFSRLNPLLDHGNQPDRDVNRLLYSGLVRFDARGLPQPDLAQAWGISQDGTIYNVELKPDLVWHDGEPLTADDVVFTVEQMRAAEGLLPEDLVEFWNEVDAVALSETSLQFRLPEPFAPFMDYLAFGVLPEHLLAGTTAEQMVDAPFNLQPVGSGPFRFDRLIVENDQITGVVLKAFANAVEKPLLDEITFRYYPDGDAAYDAYLRGEVQGLGQVPPVVLPAVLEEDGLSLYTGRQPELTMVLFNLNSDELAFFQEREVRKALMLGLNRQWIIDRVLEGQGILAEGPIFPGTWAYYSELEPTAYDPDAAVELLKDAGYVLAEEGDTYRTKGEVRLSFTLLHPDVEPYAQIAEAIRRDWERLGVEVALEPVAYESLLADHLDAREFQAALVSLNLNRSPDPDPYPFWDQAQATGGQNYSQWDDRGASEYLEQARISTNLDERTKLYRNFQVIFQKEQPALPLFYPVYNYAVSRDINGVQMGPLMDPSDRFGTVAGWSLNQGAAAAVR